MIIDWTLLREQKHTLNQILHDAQGEQKDTLVTITLPQRAHLRGLLHLCDGLEDELKPSTKD